MYTLIKGAFYMVGYSPDGDSIKFKANNIARWDKISTEHRDIFEDKLAEEEGIITLRLQGVDALETHYTPGLLSTPKDLAQRTSQHLKKPVPGGHKQPSALGEQATDAFMHLLGLTKVEWRTRGNSTWVSRAYMMRRGREVGIDKKYGDRVPGYIITDDVEKNGRPIAWVFPGSARERDGSRITQARLLSKIEQSANYQLLRKGLVYPYFFMTLPGKIRDKLAEATRLARVGAARLSQSAESADQRLPNLWIYDKTVEGVSVTKLGRITDEYEFYPYLFRKIIKHWYRKRMEEYWDALRTNASSDQSDDDSRVNLNGFFDDANPYIFVISQQDFVRLDRVVEIKRSRMRMKTHPDDIVFLS